jgi:hypothetical protein
MSLCLTKQGSLLLVRPWQLELTLAALSDFITPCFHCLQLPTPVKVMSMCLNRQGTLLLVRPRQFELTCCP